VQCRHSRRFGDRQLVLLTSNSYRPSASRFAHGTRTAPWNPAEKADSGRTERPRGRHPKLAHGSADLDHRHDLVVMRQPELLADGGKWLRCALVDVVIGSKVSAATK